MSTFLFLNTTYNNFHEQFCLQTLKTRTNYILIFMLCIFYRHLFSLCFSFWKSFFFDYHILKSIRIIYNNNFHKILFSLCGLIWLKNLIFHRIIAQSNYIFEIIRWINTLAGPAYYMGGKCDSQGPLQFFFEFFFC